MRGTRCFCLLWRRSQPCGAMLTSLARGWCQGSAGRKWSLVVSVRLAIAWLLAGALFGLLAASDPWDSPEGRRRMAARLSDPSRAQQLQLDRLVTKLPIRRGETVADIGTGGGILIPFLFQLVGSEGRILAEDIYPEFLEAARATAARAGVTNAEFILGEETDPQLPAGQVDVIVIVDTYHHFRHPQAMLAGIRRALRSGGRLIILDYYPEGFPGGPHHIPVDKPEVIQQVQRAGFRLVTNEDHIPGQQYLLVFELNE